MANSMYYDIRKRRTFQTVGELRALLNHLPAHTRVVICGDLNCFYHEDEDGRTVCLDSEDLDYQYKEAMEYMLAKETPEERDSHLESLWHELADVPVDPETAAIETQFYIFDTGTDREDIWKWFDKHYSKGVASLLYGAAPAPAAEASAPEPVHPAGVPPPPRRSSGDLPGEDLPHKYEPMDCGICGQPIIRKICDRLTVTSGYIGTSICRSCMTEYCRSTNCLGCLKGTYPNCKWLCLKRKW